MKNVVSVQQRNGKRIPWVGLFVLVALLGNESLAGGVIVTNDIIGTKFAEQMSRKIKFVHAGPIVGHWAEITDKGAFVLQAQLILDGVDVTQFTSNALFGILIRVSDPTPPDLNEFLSFFLRDDPKYVNGATKAVFLKTETVNGKEVAVAKVKLKLNLAALTLDVKVKGVYAQFERSDQPAQDPAGISYLADDLVGQPSAAVQETVEIFIFMEEAAAGLAVLGTTTIQVAGEVQSTEVNDPEIGTFSNSKVKLAGP